MLLDRIDMDLELEINDHSRTPKYRQLILEINNKIERGILPYGHKLPSINMLSEGYLLSRNTVEKAYVLLKEEGIIEAVKGKGYFVKNTQPLSKIKIFMLIDNINDYNRSIYESVTKELLESAEIDLQIYHNDFSLFKKAIEENCREYHYYMILPHLPEEHRASIIEVLKYIPRERLILMDNKVENFDRYLGAIYQDYKMDFYNAMAENLDLAKKYAKFTIVLPRENNPTIRSILDGFRRFCTFNGFDFDVVNHIDHHFTLNKGEAVIAVEDESLIQIMKIIKSSHLKLGEEIGLLSFNDAPLKQVLGNGISVISSNFEEIGRVAAKMVKENIGIESKSNFVFIRRGSF